MNECERFPEGSRRYKICTGQALLQLAKINLYRASWGLPPLLSNSDRIADGEPVGTALESSTDTKPKKPCGGCGKKKKNLKA